MSGHDEAIDPTPDGASRPGLLRKLMAAIRPEFRAEPLAFAAEDPVFGGGACRVEGCQRSARGRGLCQGHLQRWAKQGRPDLDVWLADPPAVKKPEPDATCRIGHCQLWPRAALPFCHSHANTWKVSGRPDIEEFVNGFSEAAVTEDESIRLERLGPHLKLEIQYALQCRHDERRTKTPPMVVMQVVRFLATTTAVSLLDRTEEAWRAQIGRPAPKDSNPRALLIYARRRVEDLAEAGGWETEYPRDVWRMRRLGFDGARTVRFTEIPQLWMAELAKRWTRWRLSSGLGLEAAVRPVRVITRFARFLASVGVERINQIDRAVLERYLADLHAEMAGSQRHGDHIGLLNAFFAAIRQHRWNDALPASATFFPEDHPKRGERLPRALAEHVMTQLEHAGNLDRWNNPTYRLVTVTLMRTGLRISDALRLPTDCIVTDTDGAPYLKYVNHKMKRDALVPIDEELRGLLIEQQQRITDRWPGGTPGLFPRPTKNLDGTMPTSSSTYREALYRWLERCDVRDEHGRPVHLTPHQWRHTVGTTLINRDVPQEAVRRILDHDSHAMTAHYARMHDTTVRRHWEAARKVNAQGETVTLDPEGPLAEAAWARKRLGRATQALPNGYCGLPAVRSCPHANTCLTCPMFITTPEFLPQHRTHHQQVLQIISAAEAHGRTRLVEMNQQVADNLEKIITALEHDDSEQPEAAAGAS